MTFLAGLGLGLSLIVAIGAQNVFVLRQGLRREHVALVVVICAVSDALLIAAGVSGIGLAAATFPWLLTAARWAGAAFLVTYGGLAARRAFTVDHGLDSSRSGTAAPGGRTAARAALTCVALTWLNPHVYLDTVFVVGSVAAAHGEAKWLFAAGAGAGSVLWFTSLGYGARYLGRWLSGPRAWRVVDGVIAVVMIAIAAGLIIGA